MSGAMSTELHSIPRAAPTAMAMPTANMAVLRDMKPVCISDHLGRSAIGHMTHPPISAHMGGTPLSLCWVGDLRETPELAGQAEPAKNGLSFVGARWVPTLRHPVAVPHSCEVERRLHTHRYPAIAPRLRQPPVKIGFRPEAVDRASREPDVIPESCCWDHEMDNAAGLNNTIAHGPYRL